MITPELLVSAVGCTPAAAALYGPFLAEACRVAEIVGPRRLAPFLAQLGHESGSFRHAAEIWGPTAQQRRYERDFNAPWPSSAAEARLPEFAVNRLAYTLGNSERGDGARYRGYGLIQTTGRYNTTLVRDRLRKQFGDRVPDFVAEPHRMAEPEWAVRTSVDFWARNNCNWLADGGDFEALTRRINGGLNGIEDRTARLKRAQTALAATLTPTPTPTQAAEEPEMLQALLVPLAQTLIGAFTPIAQEKLSKELGRHTDSPELAAQVATGVIQAAKTATGMADPVAAVAAAQADPAVMQRVETAAAVSLEQLLPALERIDALQQANVQRAREFNATVPLFINTPWVRLQFVQFLSLVFVAFSGWFVTQHWDSLTSELKGAVIALMIIAGWTGVRDYWMGSSDGSTQKNALLSRGDQRAK